MSSRFSARHPVGLHVLCGIELLERFAASLLGSLLLLYLNERLGLAAGTAARQIATFNAAVYLGSVLGGVVADRWLGARRAILAGAALLAVGYAVLSCDRPGWLYSSAGLAILGHALFKPNIFAAVGQLCARNDIRRDAAYSVFYVLGNIGAALGPIAGGSLRSLWGWSVAFGTASLAMSLALATGIICARSLSTEQAHRDGASFAESAASASKPWPLVVMAMLLGAVLLFTAIYEQSGLSLLLWARDCTRLSVLGHAIPPSYLLAVPGALVLVIQPLLTRIFSALATRGRVVAPFARMQIGTLCAVAAYSLMLGAAVLFGHNRRPVGIGWLFGCFVALTIGELLVYPLSMALITRAVGSRAVGTAMGIWTAAVAVGQWLAGEVAAKWTVWPYPRLFLFLVALSAAAFLLLALASRSLLHSLADQEPSSRETRQTPSKPGHSDHGMRR